MQYPKFLDNESTIGVVALSAGVGDGLEEYERSLFHFKEQGGKHELIGR